LMPVAVPLALAVPPSPVAVTVQVNVEVMSLMRQAPGVPVDPEQHPDHARDVYPVPLALKFTEHAVTTPLLLIGWHVVPDVGDSDTVGAAAGVGVAFGLTVTVV